MTNCLFAFYRGTLDLLIFCKIIIIFLIHKIQVLAQSFGTFLLKRELDYRSYLNFIYNLSSFHSIWFVLILLLCPNFNFRNYTILEHNQTNRCKISEKLGDVNIFNSLNNLNNLKLNPIYSYNNIMNDTSTQVINNIEFTQSNFKYLYNSQSFNYIHSLYIRLFRQLNFLDFINSLSFNYENHNAFFANAQYISTPSETWSCFDLNKDDPNVCNGGICASHDYCICSFSFEGKSCDIRRCNTEVIELRSTAAQQSENNYIRYPVTLSFTDTRWNHHKKPIIKLATGWHHVLFASVNWLFTKGKQISFGSLGINTPGATVLTTPRQTYIYGASPSFSVSSFDDRSLYSKNEEITGLCAGYDYSYFWTTHRIFSTGRNLEGQVGFNSGTNPDVFTEIPFNFPSNITISCGKRHVVAYTFDRLFITGAYYDNTDSINNHFGFTELTNHVSIIQDKILQVESGNDVTLLVTFTGKVFIWGSSNLVPEGPRFNPYFLDFNFIILEEGREFNIKDKIVRLSCRNDYVLMSTSRGEVISWGEEKYGNLAQPDSKVNIQRFIPYSQAKVIQFRFHNNNFDNERSQAYIIHAGIGYTSIVFEQFTESWSFGFGENNALMTTIPSTISSAEPTLTNRKFITVGTTEDENYGIYGLLKVKLDCTCPKNRGGEFCDLYTCFNIPWTDQNVCNGRGRCTCQDNCECDNPEYFSKINCMPHCFGYFGAGACSGHGECVSPNICICQKGYIGKNCEQIEHICYSNVTHPCSNAGACSIYSTCECIPSFSQGYFCEEALDDLNSVSICFGLLDSDPNVCSGNGSCINDKCQCNPGFSGDRCQYKTCFGISALDSNACSGHGFCIDIDSCLCDRSHFGADCSQFTCYERSSGVTCSGHGTCIDHNTCHCDSGYFGSQCEERSCTLESIPCHGRGTCNNDLCECSDPSKFTGVNCEKCSNGLFGDDCNIKIDQIFYWKEDFSSIYGTMIAPVSESSINCQSLFALKNLTSLGVGATCVFSDEIITITPGEDSIINIGDILWLNTNFNEQNGIVTPDHKYATIYIYAPKSELDFDFSINIFNNTPLYSYDSCQNLLININDPIPQFKSKTNFFFMDSIQNANINSLVNSTYNITLFAGYTYFLNFHYAIPSLCQNIIKHKTIITKDLINPPIFIAPSIHYINTSISLNATLYGDDLYCSKPLLSWNLRPKIPFTVTNNGSNFFIYFDDFPFKDVQYNLTLYAYSRNGFKTASSSQIIQALRPPLNAVIQDGTYREILASGQLFVLDGSSSYDLYIDRCIECHYFYKWECFDVQNPSLVCPFKSFLSPTSKIMNLPSMIAEGRTIRFRLTFSNYGRDSIAEQIIYFRPYFGPKFFISPPSYTIVGFKNTFKLVFLTPMSIIQIRWFSSSVSVNTNTVIGSLDSDIIVFKENVLTPGVKTFTAVITFESGQTLSTTVQVEIFLNPYDGILTVSPNNGIMSSTIFVVKVENFKGPHSLKYQFGYKYLSSSLSLTSFGPNSLVTTRIPISGTIKFYATAQDVVTGATTTVESQNIFIQNPNHPVEPTDPTPTDPEDPLNPESPLEPTPVDPTEVIEESKNLAEDAKNKAETGLITDALILLLNSVDSLNSNSVYKKFPISNTFCVNCGENSTCVENHCICNQTAGDTCKIPYQWWENEVQVRKNLFSVLSVIPLRPVCNELPLRLLILKGLLLHRHTVDLELIQKVINTTDATLENQSICSSTDLQLVVDICSYAFNSLLSISYRIGPQISQEEINTLFEVHRSIYNVTYVALRELVQEDLYSFLEEVIYTSDWIDAAVTTRFIREVASPSIFQVNVQSLRYSFGELVYLPTDINFKSIYDIFDKIAFQMLSIKFDAPFQYGKTLVHALPNAASQSIYNYEIVSDVVSMKFVDLITLVYSNVSDSVALYKLRGNFSIETNYTCFSLSQNSIEWDMNSGCTFIAESSTIAYCKCIFSTFTFDTQFGAFKVKTLPPLVPTSPNLTVLWIILSVLISIAICCFFIINIIIFILIVIASLLILRRKNKKIERVFSESTLNSIFDPIPENNSQDNNLLGLKNANSFVSEDLDNSEYDKESQTSEKNIKVLLNNRINSNSNDSLNSLVSQFTNSEIPRLKSRIILPSESTFNLVLDAEIFETNVHKESSFNDVHSETSPNETHQSSDKISTSSILSEDTLFTNTEYLTHLNDNYQLGELPSRSPSSLIVLNESRNLRYSPYPGFRNSTKRSQTPFQTRSNISTSIHVRSQTPVSSSNPSSPLTSRSTTPFSEANSSRSTTPFSNTNLSRNTSAFTNLSQNSFQNLSRSTTPMIILNSSPNSSPNQSRSVTPFSIGNQTPNQSPSQSRSSTPLINLNPSPSQSRSITPSIINSGNIFDNSPNLNEYNNSSQESYNANFNQDSQLRMDSYKFNETTLLESNNKAENFMDMYSDSTNSIEDRFFSIVVEDEQTDTLNQESVHVPTNSNNT